jgi:hypothetical protein
MMPQFHAHWCWVSIDELRRKDEFVRGIQRNYETLSTLCASMLSLPDNHYTMFIVTNGHTIIMK